jgi:hypothetical protein
VLYEIDDSARGDDDEPGDVRVLVLEHRRDAYAAGDYGPS